MFLHTLLFSFAARPGAWQFNQKVSGDEGSAAREERFVKFPYNSVPQGMLNQSAPSLTNPKAVNALALPQKISVIRVERGNGEQSSTRSPDSTNWCWPNTDKHLALKIKFISLWNSEWIQWGQLQVPHAHHLISPYEEFWIFKSYFRNICFWEASLSCLHLSFWNRWPPQSEP